MKKKNSKFKGIYISGPMSGVPAWEKVDSFMRAEMHLKEMFPDTRIINPIHLSSLKDVIGNMVMQLQKI